MDERPPETVDGTPERPASPIPGPQPLRGLVEGRYVDFLPVGEGGMGIVYWAQDQDLKRQVAFKVIRPPTEGRSLGVTPAVPQALETPAEGSHEADDFSASCTRFLQEAWVTGGLEHPGIVPIYELGTTAAGVPYYTMKFIQDSRTLGTALQEVADAGLEERLALLEPFLKVCDTIRYAHSQGVLHRDLKPENIALGRFGEVLVLDWGLARLTSERGHQGADWKDGVDALRSASGLQTLGGLVGTPGYMAPEAALGDGEAVDERCDVYSLGAILHELLTHHLPIDVEPLTDYIDKLRSRRAPDPRDRDPDLPESLARICASALEPDPARRTPSVDALAEALRSWQARRAIEREVALLLEGAERGLLEARTVAADAALRQLDDAALAARRALELAPGDPAATACLGRVEDGRRQALHDRDRMARRHALRRAGAAALLVATIAALLVAGILEKARRKAEHARQDAAQARGRAEADRARAETVMGYMVGDMQQSLEPLGRLDLLAGLGHKAKAYYDELPEADRHPDSLRNGTHALRKLGEVYHEQGDLPAARRSFEAAVALASALPEDEEGEAGYLRTRARAKLCGVLIAQGYPRKAVTELEDHLADVQARAGRHPENAEYKAVLAEAHDLLCRACIGTLDVDAALAASARAVEIAEALAASDDEQGTRHRALVQYLLTPARGLRMRGENEQGLARARRALDLVSTWRTRRPSDMRWLRLEADARYILAFFLETTRRFEDALPPYRQAEAGYERLAALDPQNMAVRHRLAVLSHRIGETLRQQALAESPPSEAARSVHHGPWKRAFEIQQALVEHDPSNAYWLHSMIGHCDRMSTVVRTEARRQGREDGDELAQSYREQALHWAERLVACDPENVLWQHLYAYTLFRRAAERIGEEPDRSVSRLQEVVRICETLFPDHPGGQIELAILCWWAAEVLDKHPPLPVDEKIRAFRVARRLTAQAGAAYPEAVEIAEARILVLTRLAELLTPTAIEEAGACARTGLELATRTLQANPQMSAAMRRNIEACSKRNRATIDAAANSSQEKPR